VILEFLVICKDESTDVAVYGKIFHFKPTQRCQMGWSDPTHL